MQQNPRMSVKKTGIGSYGFHQTILKKQSRETQDPS